MLTLSQMVQEVRELYLGKSQPTNPFTCNAMSPRVILIQLTQKYIEKYTMAGEMKNDPLSGEESWDSDWNGQECDMNILEPLVEISDNSKDNTKKRKKKPDNAERRKRGRPSSVNQSKDNSGASVPTESVFVDVSIKQEPQDSVPEPETLTLQDTSLGSVPMATIPVGNSASPLPVYRVPSSGLRVFTHQQLMLPQNAKKSVQNTNNNPSTSNKVNESNQNLVTNIKQEEEMGNVFVMPFGADIETADNFTSKKTSSSQPEIIECNSTEETRNDRTAAIVASIGVSGSSTNRKLRDLTFRLVELNNKNLQCDSRIEKIKDEYKKRLQVAEIEKKGIEQEIDKVLASIQDWKDARKQQM